MIEVQVQLSPIFSTFRREVQKLQDEVLFAGAQVLRRNYIASVTTGPTTTRFFKTGAGLQSTREEFDEKGNKSTYSLIPQAFYMVFGEYGTGRRGAETGTPAPRGWRYGSKQGMRARRFGRNAVQVSRPEVNRQAIALAQKFAASMTTN